MGWVCACACAFARGRGYKCTRHKPSRRSSGLCGRAERAAGTGGGKLIRGGRNQKEPGLCTRVGVREGEGVCMYLAQNQVVWARFLTGG
jgi:hypothetical protein